MKEEIRNLRLQINDEHFVYLSDKNIDQILDLILNEIDKAEVVYVEDWTSKDGVKPIIEAINKEEIKKTLRE